MGLKLNIAEHLKQPTNHYEKNLISLFAYDLLGNYESNLIHFYQYHRLQILQQDDHEVQSHRI